MTKMNSKSNLYKNRMLPIFFLRTMCSPKINLNWGFKTKTVTMLFACHIRLLKSLLNNGLLNLKDLMSTLSLYFFNTGVRTNRSTALQREISTPLQRLQRSGLYLELSKEGKIDNYFSQLIYSRKKLAKKIHLPTRSFKLQSNAYRGTHYAKNVSCRPAIYRPINPVYLHLKDMNVILLPIAYLKELMSTRSLYFFNTGVGTSRPTSSYLLSTCPYTQYSKIVTPSPFRLLQRSGLYLKPFIEGKIYNYFSQLIYSEKKLIQIFFSTNKGLKLKSNAYRCTYYAINVKYMLVLFRSINTVYLHLENVNLIFLLIAYSSEKKSTQKTIFPTKCYKLKSNAYWFTQYVKILKCKPFFFKMINRLFFVFGISYESKQQNLAFLQHCLFLAIKLLRMKLKTKCIQPIILYWSYVIITVTVPESLYIIILLSCIFYVVVNLKYITGSSNLFITGGRINLLVSSLRWPKSSYLLRSLVLTANLPLQRSGLLFKRIIEGKDFKICTCKIYGGGKPTNKTVFQKELSTLTSIAQRREHYLRRFVFSLCWLAFPTPCGLNERIMSITKSTKIFLNYVNIQLKNVFLQRCVNLSTKLLANGMRNLYTMFANLHYTLPCLPNLLNLKTNFTVACHRISIKMLNGKALKQNFKKEIETCLLVFFLWPFSSHYYASKIYAFLDTVKLLKFDNNNVNFCENTNFYLIIGANMSGGFDVEGLNRTMELLHREQDQLISSNVEHRLSNNIGPDNPSRNNIIEPAPLIDLSDNPTIRPEENTAPAQEAMAIDTSVQFFSNTAPAILAELRRQKLEESTFLTEQIVHYAPLRAEYDRYINQFLLDHKLTRTSIVLHRPNGEPAERHIKPGERLGDGWFAEKLSIGCGKKKVDITITMPPNKPLLIVVGASHASRMANLAIMSDPLDLKTQNGQYLWQRTVFVRTVASAVDLLPIIKEVLAKVCRLLIEVHGNFVNLGTNIVLIPMSWDAINTKINMDKFAQNLLDMANTVFSFITKTAWQQRWTLSFSFTELPLLHKYQAHLYRLNHVIRFVNELLSRNHPPIRPWLSLTEVKPKNVETLKSVEVGILQNRYLPHENRDGTHLSATGYTIWLQTIINGSIMTIVDQSEHPIEDDFEQVDTIHINCIHAAYFQTTATLKRAIENDLLNVSLIAKLRQLERPRIDCSRLAIEYPEIREIEEVVPDEVRPAMNLLRRHRHVANGGGPSVSYQHRPRHDDHRGTRSRRSNRGMYNRVYYPY